MATKPTKLPRWATGASAAVIEPSSGLKDLGFVGGERPPAEYENFRAENTYDWLKWLDDGLLTRDDLTDHSPILTTTDRAGAPRHYLTPEGFWMGPAIQEQFRFQRRLAIPQGATLCSGDYFELAYKSAGVDVQVDPFTINGNTPVLRFTMTPGSSLQGAYASQGLPPIINVESTTVVMEGRMTWTSLGAVESYWGLNDLVGVSDADDLFGGTTRSAMFVTRDSGDTMIYALCSDGSGMQLFATGVSISAIGVWYNFRIEYHGASTPIGSVAGASVRFFINGVQVLERFAAHDIPVDGDSGVVIAVNRDVNAPVNNSTIFDTIKLAWSGYPNAAPPV